MVGSIVEHRLEVGNVQLPGTDGPFDAILVEIAFAVPLVAHAFSEDFKLLLDALDCEADPRLLLLVDFGFHGEIPVSWNEVDCCRVQRCQKRWRPVSRPPPEGWWSC